MKETTLSRRTFVGGIAAGVGGIASTTTVSARGKPSRSAQITFEDQIAFVGPVNTGPMEAAVLTKDVHMPQGGRVVILLGDTPIGWSMRRLPAGNFRKLRVAVRALSPGTYNLDAVLAREANFDGEGQVVGYTPYEIGNEPVSREAEIIFP